MRQARRKSSRSSIQAARTKPPKRRILRTLKTNAILCGDCKTVLKRFPAESIDLIFTSPPYGNARKGKYNGVAPGKFVKWFLERSEELKRVLKKRGTLILNIKESAAGGERRTYVLELILKLREQGWLWTEEFVWHKRNSFPGKWPNRFRDGWERLLQFNKSRDFKMYQRAVMVDMGDWAGPRLKNLSDKDKTREHSTLNGKFGVNLENWLKRKKAYPDNVLHLPTACSNNGHPATFPAALPEWFIKLFTKEDDVVLDPFVGSGMTAIAAIHLSRRYIGVDIQSEFCSVARRRIAKKPTVAKAPIDLQKRRNGTLRIPKPQRDYSSRSVYAKTSD